MAAELQGRRRVRLLVTVGFAAAVAMPLAVSAHASAAGFAFRDTALPGSGGAEPSIAVDTGPTPSNGDIYVTDIGSSPHLWHSYDLGQTWAPAVAYDTQTGCTPSVFGDEDVTALPNGNIVVGHLNVYDNVVQVSTDHGQTFGACTHIGPESDREWFGNSGSNVVYYAYHDFVGEVPILCTSIDGGNTFLGCNQVFENAQVAQCAENTIMARPVAVDPTDQSVSIPYSCSTAAQNAANPPYGPLHDYYIAHSAAVVQGVAPVFTTTPVYVADTSNGKNPNLANIFSTLQIDSAGNYYMMFAGTMDDNDVLENPYHVYLTTSTDKGKTWTTPLVVDNEPDGKGTHIFPDMQVTSPGNMDIVWLSAVDPTTGADVTGEPNGQCGSTTSVTTCTDNGQNVGMAPGGPIQANWKAVFVQSTNALSSNPTFTTAQVSPGSMHAGEVCTNGIVCGGSDRSLLDYISIQVDCSGNAHMAYADNFGHALQTHEADQTSGTTITPPATCPASVATPEAPFAPVLALGGVAVAAGIGVRRSRRPATAAR